MHSDFYSNKVVLITGGSMGIGKSLAEQILNQGGSVVITGRNSERLHTLTKNWADLAERFLAVELDVSDETGLQNLIQIIQNRFGRLDVLINNAALSAYGDLENTDAKVIHALIDTNIKGLLLTTKATLPLLRQNRGCVLFISSLAGLYGLPGYSLYSMSKMALSGLRQSLRTELENAGVLPAIAYIGFTQNESDKKTLNALGSLEAVPSRNPRFTFSRVATAQLILNQVARRKKVVIQGKLGKLIYLLSRFCPGLLHFFLRRNYLKSQ